MTELKEVKQNLDSVFDYLNKQELGEVGKEAINDLENALTKVENLILHGVSQQSEPLHTKVFKLANELAVNGYGNEAVKMHEICNGM